MKRASLNAVTDMFWAKHVSYGWTPRRKEKNSCQNLSRPFPAPPSYLQKAGRRKILSFDLQFFVFKEETPLKQHDRYLILID